MSKTSNLPDGSVITCNDPHVMKELAILCSFVCVCDKNPIEKASKKKVFTAEIPMGKKKPQYRQSCVDGLAEAYLSINTNSPIVPEAPYYVGEDKTVIPLLQRAEQRVSWRRAIYATRLAKAVAGGTLEDDKLYEYLNKVTSLKKLKETLAAAGVDYANLDPTNQLKKPDAVILRDAKGTLDPSNVAGIAEIKFPSDKWDGEQYKGYLIIAGGDKKKIHTLTPTSCMCQEGKSGYEAVHVPEAAHAVEKQYLDEAAKAAVAQQSLSFSIPKPPQGFVETLAAAAAAIATGLAASPHPLARNLGMMFLLLNAEQHPPEA